MRKFECIINVLLRVYGLVPSTFQLDCFHSEELELLDRVNLFLEPSSF